MSPVVHGPGVIEDSSGIHVTVPREQLPRVVLGSWPEAVASLIVSAVLFALGVGLPSSLAFLGAVVVPLATFLAVTVDRATGVTTFNEIGVSSRSAWKRTAWSWAEVEEVGAAHRRVGNLSRVVVSTHDRRMAHLPGCDRVGERASELHELLSTHTPRMTALDN